jgi:hypothetical protein
MPLTKHHVGVLSIVLALAIVSVAAANVQDKAGISQGLHQGIHVVASTNTALVNMWGANGSVVNSIGGESTGSNAITIGNSLFAAYRYYNGSDYELYGQMFNSTGGRTWGEQGIGIQTIAGVQDQPIIVAPYGYPTIIFSDSSNGFANIRAQQLNANGNKQWGTTGVPIVSGSWNAQHVVAAIDADGGFYIAWSDNRNAGTSWDIYAQHINSTGQPQWPVNGVPVCNAAGEQKYPRLGVYTTILYVAWEDWRGADADIFAQKLNSTGGVNWTTNGVAVCNAADNQFEPKIAMPYGIPFVVWKDCRNGISDADVYAQQLNVLNGAAVFEQNGRGVCNITDTLQDLQVETGSDSVFMAWADNRAGNLDIYAQKMDWMGQMAWGANGTAVFAGVGVQERPRICVYGSDTWYAWDDDRNGNRDVYLQKMHPNGTRVYSTSGFGVCVELGDQWATNIAYDPVLGACVTWDALDGPSTTKVHAQNLYEDQLPIVSCTITPNPAEINNVVEFTDLSSDADGSIVAWAWSFGDGGVSTAQNTTHVYTIANSFTVVLTVTDDLGLTSSFSQPFSTYNPSPSVDGYSEGVIACGLAVGIVAIVLYRRKR